MAARFLGHLRHLFCAAALLLAAPARARAGDPSTDLVDLHSASSLAEWKSVDDRVMGGISKSRVDQAATHAVRFSGSLSLEQNGGFASVRRPLAPSTMLSASDGIALRVRGDGRTYQLRLQTNGQYDGVAYRVSFATRAGEWIDVRAAFDDFVPTWRGQVLPDVPPLDPARVSSLAFMVAGDQAGSFELEIARVETFAADRSRP